MQTGMKMPHPLKYIILSFFFFWEYANVEKGEEETCSCKNRDSIVVDVVIGMLILFSNLTFNILTYFFFLYRIFLVLKVFLYDRTADHLPHVHIPLLVSDALL